MNKPRVLTFSTLYPSSVRPGHGIFVETRLRELLKTDAVEARVMAPVPWFPSTAKRFGEYAQFAATPRREQRNGLEVHHPRYLQFLQGAWDEWVALGTHTGRALAAVLAR